MTLSDSSVQFLRTLPSERHQATIVPEMRLRAWHSLHCELAFTSNARRALGRRTVHPRGRDKSARADPSFLPGVVLATRVHCRWGLGLSKTFVYRRGCDGDRLKPTDASVYANIAFVYPRSLLKNLFLM